jgi:hypothetical protein
MKKTLALITILAYSCSPQQKDKEVLPPKTKEEIRMDSIRNAFIVKNDSMTVETNKILDKRKKLIEGK